MVLEHARPAWRTCQHTQTVTDHRQTDTHAKRQRAEDKQRDAMQAFHAAADPQLAEDKAEQPNEQSRSEVTQALDIKDEAVDLTDHIVIVADSGRELAK